MSNPSIRTCSSGFSLVELLLALGILGVVMGAVMSITLASREVLETDQNRTSINQNIRGGMDLLGIDVRQAGERLPNDVPAMQIINGTSGAPDRLILRRNEIDAVMPVCKPVVSGSKADAIFVSTKGGKVPPGCAEMPDTDSDGWPDNLQIWRDYRIAHGGVVTAFIYNPTTNEGEFFLYDAEDNSSFHIHKANGANWTYDYMVNEQPRVYILEQREFEVSDNRLKAIINADTANPLNLVSDIVDLQARGYMIDGTVLDTVDNSVEWADIESIEITLVGKRDFKGRSMKREVTSRFFPRNVLTVTD